MTDQQWFALLYDASFKRLALLAYAYTGDLAEAEALAERAFTTVYYRRARIQDAPDPEAELRRLLPRRAVDWPPAEDRLADELRELPTDLRLTVAVHHIADLSIEDTASIVDCPQETVRRRLTEAHAELAGRIGGASLVELALRELRQRLFNAISQPELTDLLDRARRRRTNRHARFAVGLAALAVLGLVPMLRTPAPVESAAPRTSSSATSSTTSTFRAPPKPTVFAVDFADATHGYALRATCSNRSARCTRDLLVTEDGVNWQRKQVPARQGLTPNGQSGTLLVLGPRQLLLGDGWGALARRTRRPEPTGDHPLLLQRRRLVLAAGDNGGAGFRRAHPAWSAAGDGMPGPVRRGVHRPPAGRAAARLRHPRRAARPACTGRARP